ncbi:hypothetical protein PGT21_036295 [Puccinia graminis f. sp. tritici]|uniref:Uncharacterized protein n=1 Tax=Puccinia graminis f. sp. tritici TaxID=56615 RepID=A0A5B0QDR8_PUCGR|nr:hypothetical protein PGT21_036295 [Puccinia graminis f. sp. tritici]
MLSEGLGTRLLLVYVGFWIVYGTSGKPTWEYDSVDHLLDITDNHAPSINDVLGNNLKPPLKDSDQANEARDVIDYIPDIRDHGFLTTPVVEQTVMESGFSQYDQLSISIPEPYQIGSSQNLDHLPCSKSKKRSPLHHQSSVDLDSLSNPYLTNPEIISNPTSNKRATNFHPPILTDKIPPAIKAKSYHLMETSEIHANNKIHHNSMCENRLGRGMAEGDLISGNWMWQGWNGSLEIPLESRVMFNPAYIPRRLTKSGKSFEHSCSSSTENESNKMLISTGTHSKNKIYHNHMANEKNEKDLSKGDFIECGLTHCKFWNDVGVSSHISIKKISTSPKIIVKKSIDILRFDMTAFDSLGKSQSTRDHCRVASMIEFIDSIEPRSNELYIPAGDPEKVPNILADITLTNFYIMMNQERNFQKKEIKISGELEGKKMNEKNKIQNDSVNELISNKKNWFRFWKERANIHISDERYPNYIQLAFEKSRTCLLFYVDIIGVILHEYHMYDLNDHKDMNQNLLQKAFEMTSEYSPNSIGKSKSKSPGANYLDKPKKKLVRLERVWNWLGIFIKRLDNEAFKKIFFSDGISNNIPKQTQVFFNHVFYHSIQNLNRRLCDYYDHIDNCKSEINHSPECSHQSIIYSLGPQQL